MLDLLLFTDLSFTSLRVLQYLGKIFIISVLQNDRTFDILNFSH
jgi:hypothetical protein